MLVEILVFLGITLMIYSVIIQRKLIGMTRKDATRNQFNYLLPLIVLFLLGYIFFMWMNGTMDIDENVSLLVGVILFFGAIFVVAVLEINCSLIRRINKHTEKLEVLNRVLDKRRVQTEAGAKELREKEVQMLKEIAKLKRRKAPEADGELQKKIEELQRFQRMAIGRELKMVELKKRLNEEGNKKPE